ncbi:DUF349 domain-containing protein [Agaribacter flavus]|uniref:DUF349 domain-containing protein n=1 Tax=Agaribacter flavus TaxID=1902781 RepID=A0ABV7FML6_9ALTE
MIFKQLFLPNYKHKSPEKRKEAVAQVVEVNETNKQWLHELAFNDEDLSVKLAALEKLDQFTMWLKTYESKGNDVLVSKAKVVATRMLEDQAYVSDSLFEDFVAQARHPEIIKRMLGDSKRLASNSSLYLETLFKFASKHEIQRFYRESASEAQQLLIVERFEDEKELKRLRKNANAQTVVDIVDAKLLEIERRSQIPQALIQGTTLINSQLLALIESRDYPYVEEKKRKLVEEFNGLKSQFEYLSERQSAEIAEKFLSLKEKIDKHLVALKPEFEQQLVLKENTELLSELKQQIEDIATQVDFLLNADSENDVNIQSDLLSHSLADANNTHERLSVRISENSTPAHRQCLKVLAERIEEYNGKLAGLSEAVKQNHALKIKLEVIKQAWDEFTQGNLSDEAISEEFERAKSYFKNASKMSSELQGEWRRVKQNIKAHFDEKKEQNSKLLKRCFSKLNVVQALIKEGKLKAAISTFAYADSLFQSIPQAGRSLQNKYADVAAQINEFKDWQSYVAAPKKPELLAEVESLISDKALEPAARANKIKQLRADWNSLGRLNNTEDDALNTQFDEKLEIAFAPCREYYAALEAERLENANKAKAILAEIESLHTEQDIHILAKALPALANQFHKIKALNQADRVALGKSFKALSAPLYGKLDTFYEENRQAKQKLVDTAKELSGVEDLHDAANKAKDLQQRWKHIGFAGKQHDSVLWQSFRQANDSIFGQLTEEKDKLSQQAEREFKEHLSNIEALRQHIEEEDSVSQLNEYKATISGMYVDNKLLKRGLFKQFSEKKSDTISELENRITYLNSANAQGTFTQILAFLKAWKSEEDITSIAPLPSKVRNAIEGKYLKHDFYEGLSREHVFYTMLLLLPDEIEVDKSLQLKVMAAKLEGQQGLEPKDAWLSWISFGPLQDQDTALLEQYKPILLRNLSLL